jgi:hypothetical protein
MSFNNEYNIGDLVWIPAYTDLMYNFSHDFKGHPWKSIVKKEPVYGLIIEKAKAVSKVLVGSEIYYVKNEEVFGENNDYKS